MEVFSLLEPGRAGWPMLWAGWQKIKFFSIQFNLLEPASCHAALTELRVERMLPAEIIQIRKTRTIPVLRCLAVVTEVSQYCGHSSAAGVMRFLKFRETATVESQSCRDAFSNKGKLEVRGRVYPAVIGSTSSHHDYLAGGLEDS